MSTEQSKDATIDKMVSDFKVPAGEEGIFHVILEVKRFSAATGARQSKPRFQTAGPKAFKVLKKNWEKQGYTVVVVHDPNKWLAGQAEVKKHTQAEQEAARKDAAIKAAECEASEREKEIDRKVNEALEAQATTMRAETDAAIKAAVAQAMKEATKSKA